ncbi:hypothetical protein GCM10010174_64070 [Kutzneria viridogrisea]|uniref:MalT-like TPR region domain-containing protein n=2 Tax=Kutzneria TaxID=43356 RepID=W5WIC9_9PSEU|nr:hypothetical protein [Kutzneria albida]AHI00506.1 hypothetical protein KALB_7148 [Kutzneria albida DSM 43870]MBA8925685.1 tetratricopeptide (TPR) repeat protein [Kutzneria viridogrisea]
MSYEHLSPRASHVFLMLASYPGADFPGALANAVQPGGEAVLGELVREGLLRAVPGGRYRYSSLARAHALQHAEGTALERIVAWYLDYAVAADKAVSRFRWRLSPRYEQVAAFPGTDVEALDLLEADRASFVSLVRAAHESGMDELVVGLCEALWGLHFHRKHYTDWKTVNELGVVSAQRLGDRRAEGRIRCQLGFHHLELDEVERAVEQFDLALRADRSVQHHQGMATDLESLALAHYGVGRYQDALDCLLAAEPLAVRAGQEQQIALRGHHYYRVLSALGRAEEALAGLTGTLHAMRERGDRYNEGRVLTSLGEAQLRVGANRAAIEALTPALAIMQELRRLFQEAVVREVLCAALLAAGDRGGAVAHAEHALAIYQVLDHPRANSAAQRLERLNQR